MKRAAMLVSYLFCYAGSSLAQSNERQLAPSSVGKVHLGMTVDSLYEAYGRENVRLIDRGGEGGFNPAVQVFHPSEPQELIGVADVGLFCGAYRLTGISVASPQFRTSDGLGVWSTVGEVKRKQPTAKMNRDASALSLSGVSLRPPPRSL